MKMLFWRGMLLMMHMRMLFDEHVVDDESEMCIRIAMACLLPAALAWDRSFRCALHMSIVWEFGIVVC
jgi:hypothetical protein